VYLCQLLTALVNARSQKDFSDALTALSEQYQTVYQHFVDNWLSYEEDFGLYNFAGIRTLFNASNNRLEWYVFVSLEYVQICVYYNKHSDMWTRECNHTPV